MRGAGWGIVVGEWLLLHFDRCRCCRWWRDCGTRFCGTRLRLVLVIDVRLAEFHLEDLDRVSLINKTVHMGPGSEERACTDACVPQRMTEAGDSKSTTRKCTLGIS